MCMRTGRDDKAFEALAVPHLELVYRVARRLSGDDHEAEDLVQETYLKAYRAFERFELRDHGIKPWLLKILHNSFLNRATRQKRAPRATDDRNLELLSEPDESDNPVGAPPELDFESLDAEVVQAIDGLRGEFRSVLLLWATMELSYQEIADTLSVPIGTVMSRLHRARQQLVRALADYARANRLVVEDSER